MYEIYQQQHFETGTDEIWDFISNPSNLNEITPPYLNFKITSDVPDEMYEGLLIHYEVTLPMLGLTEWVTEIKHIIPGKQFVDEQRVGPYAFWYHYHGLEEHGGGTMMTDRIHYRPPYGFLGDLANNLFIGRRLYAIFKYRYDMLDLTFNS